MSLARGIGTLLALAGLCEWACAAPTLPPADLPGLRNTNEFFPGVKYRASVPTAESLLGFPQAQRAASASEIERCLKAWSDAAPDRTRLVEYARSHEGRPLYYMVVTSQTNLARMDQTQAGLARLADPRDLPDVEAERLIAGLPAVAWLSYTIHGDETEGSDAALVVLYHLIAADDPKVAKLLEGLVVIVDPLMNPDGRERFIKMMAEHRGAMPSVDDQSLLHDGYWPRGRGNHYYFDLNRDYVFAVHPETRGRMREIARWNPVLFVDAHGMGPQDTHLFSPPRQPINPHIPARKEHWAKVFVRDQAAAFDAHKLVYYHGEWNEEWYPGFTDAWASYRGAIGILYEQARIAEDAVRRPEGRLLNYRESVQHHVIGSMANLATTQSNAKALLAYFHATRKEAVDPKGRYAQRVFAFLPTANRSRQASFADLLRLQGFELYEAGADFAAPAAVDLLGRELKNVTVPAGALLVPNRQPLAHLVAALLEFDTRLSDTALTEERQELLRKGRSRIYDVTAWSLPMMYGLEGLTLPTELPASAKPLQAPGGEAKGVVGEVKPAVAFVIDGADDLSMAVAARLMEKGVKVRAAEKPFRFGDRAFARGSVVVTVLDNRTYSGDMPRCVSETAAEAGLAAVAVSGGLGEGDLPDLGGEHFRLLQRPQIAVLSRGAVAATDFGSIWHTLDYSLGIRHSHIDEGDRLDLSRYNVLVMPARYSDSMPAGLLGSLKDWVRAGGTLVAIGGSVGSLTQEKAEFSKVRQLPDVLGRLGDYELVVLREWLGVSGELPTAERIWAHKPAVELTYPWQTGDGAYPEEKELKKRDSWQSLFMPQGAIAASRTDTNHWLTAGCGEMLPVIVGHQPLLMAADGAEAPIRLGYWTTSVVEKATNTVAPPAPAQKAGSKPVAGAVDGEAKTAEKKDADKKDKKETPRMGWVALPKGVEMHLRMSGLLWPEAAHRIANAAYVTREPFGRGQIILFASSPTFRASTRGMMRVFCNAVVCGPGFGAAPRIEL